MDEILKLQPYYCKKIWGYEKWLLSTHRNGCCTVEGTGKKLNDVLGKELSILVKTIQADEVLSVQVHPDDEYSKKHEKDSGKAECWYILDAKKSASVICGIKSGFDRESFSKTINNGMIKEKLNKIDVKKGDLIYIPAGTVHAIEGGIKLLEIQQSSDITYRMYDWGRNRKLHVEKSLDVIDYKKKNEFGKIDNFTKFETPYFTIEKILVGGVYEEIVKEEFQVFTVVSGYGRIVSSECSFDLNYEDTIYIRKDVEYKIEGMLELIKTYI